MKEFNSFFLAGTDTTSNYLQGMIYLIFEHPKVEQKLRQEIDEFMSGDDYSYENLKKLVYIDCIQKETTRFFGPVNYIFGRQVS